MESVSLEQWRKLSSDQSLGLSHQRIYQCAEEWLKALKSKGSLLDIGAGQGLFLKGLAERGSFASLAACDLMEPPAGWPMEVSWTKADLNLDIPLASESQDVITALEVIEHLENPRQLVRECFRLLKPGGYLLLSTPNNESWRAILSFILRGHFVAFTETSYPAHIVALNRMDLRRILQEAGFQDVQFQFSQLGSLPALTSITWQNLSFGRLRGLRFSDNLFCLAQKR
ncbi:MAG: methyltransferase domain-containing protein [Bdellovibrionales bacterium]|nr:methyltransferase domain-containing protein [Bdellovibrionales bacterium]